MEHQNVIGPIGTEQEVKTGKIGVLQWFFYISWELYVREWIFLIG